MTTTMLSLPDASATMNGAISDQAGVQAVGGLNDRRSASQPERRTLRVLSFEDNYFFGERIRDALLAWEFDVEWCVGAAAVDGTKLEGIAPDSTADELKTVPINAADVDIVFTDCSLIGEFSGIDIVRWCVANGVPVIAISGNSDLNRMMINAGAMLAVTKEWVFKVILAGLPVERLARRR